MVIKLKSLVKDETLCDVLAATDIGDTAATSAVSWIFCVHGFTF